MANSVPARLTAAQGRRFGFTVCGAFLVLAGIAWWRDHAISASVLATLGGALTAAGLTIPSHLGPVERAWMGLAHAISKVTTPIVMGVMYLLVLTPVGLLKRMAAGNALVHGGRGQTFWQARPPNARRSTSMRRQF